MLEGIKISPKKPIELNCFTFIVEVNDEEAYEFVRIAEKDMPEYVKVLEVLEELKGWDATREQNSEATEDKITAFIEDELSDMIPCPDCEEIHDISISRFEYTDENGIVYDVDWDIEEVKKLNPELFI